MTDQTTEKTEDEKFEHDQEIRKSYLAGAYEQIIALLECGYFTVRVIPHVVKHLDSLVAALRELGAEFKSEADPEARKEFDALIDSFINQPKRDSHDIPIDFGPGLDV